jgi:3-oxoacyl-[acyl-carrier protein] reductase
MKISGAKIIITGGSSGIGKQTAKELILKGASIIITGRDEKNY